MSEPESQGKSYDIPKRLVWDAWLKVKENGGPAGAGGVTIGQYEENLKGNLYKLWLCRVADYAERAAPGDRSACWRPWAALIGSA